MKPIDSSAEKMIEEALLSWRNLILGCVRVILTGECEVSFRVATSPTSRLTGAVCCYAEDAGDDDAPLSVEVTREYLDPDGCYYEEHVDLKDLGNDELCALWSHLKSESV